MLHIIAVQRGHTGARWGGEGGVCGDKKKKKRKDREKRDGTRMTVNRCTKMKVNDIKCTYIIAGTQTSSGANYF